MSTSPDFPPHGFHIERTDSPSGPMDILAENEGIKLDIDLVAGSKQPETQVVDLPIVSDRPEHRQYSALSIKDLMHELLDANGVEDLAE